MLSGPSRRRLLPIVVLAATLPWLYPQAQVAPVTRYDAITDREVRPEPSLPALGPAGSTVFDPAFSSQLWRITDGSTRPGAVDRSFKTPSGTHQNAWSADGAYFYVVSRDGTIVPFTFDPVAERARRIDPEPGGDGGFVLRFYTEPHFSYTRPGIVYGSFSGAGATLRTIDEYDFSRRTYERLLDLDSLVPGLGGTFIGGIGSGGGDTERLLTFFGGASQDRHRYVVVFDRANTGRRQLVDTVASTIDGRPTNITLNFLLHHAFIERSGRFAMLYPTTVDRQPPRRAEPAYLWNLESGTFTELPSLAALSNGHDAYGYGVMVNKDCCRGTTWDAAQWQFRTFSTPLTSRDLILPILQPRSVFLTDHPSWHNARPDVLTPYISALYRYGGNDAPWRPWDDEIVAIETAAAEGSGATVWRFAHHRSDIAYDDDPSRIYFWYTPRPNVSLDGRWVLFTSNWEKRLGLESRPEAGGRYRQDVFLLKLRGLGGGAAAESGPVRITTTSLPAGRRNSPYSATLQTSGGSRPITWRLESGSLPPGLQLDRLTGTISGASRTAGTWRFAVSASAPGSTDRRGFWLVINR